MDHVVTLTTLVCDRMQSYVKLRFSPGTTTPPPIFIVTLSTASYIAVLVLTIEGTSSAPFLR
jgi:hypothetical protein